MANMRNKWEFYGSILEALGVDYTDAELKNNETLRAKILEGLGVEYTYDDVNQYPLWREKLVEGVGNMSGGGGGSDFTIKTIVKNVTTGQVITDPKLYVDAQPLLYVNIVDGDEPYLFNMEGIGSIGLYYQDYETSSLIDTVTLKTSYPLKLQRFVVMLGENELRLDDGTFNGTPVDVLNGFNIEEGGTIMLNVIPIS